MKTKLSALLVLSTALILTSCGGKAEEALNEAKEYYYQTIKDDSTSLQSYELNSKLVVAGVTYTVEWELNVTSGSADVVKLGAVNAQGKYPVIIDFDKATQSETKYTISCTIKDADGNETSFELDRTVPKFTFVDHATYVKECKENDGDIISIKAYVIGAIGKESSSSFGSLYLQDAQGNGYYAYAPSLSLPKKTREALNEAFPIGAEVIVTGSATLYSGQYEFNKGCSAVTTGNTAESAGVSLTYTNATADFAAAETPKDAAKLDKYQNARVTLEDCKLISNSGDYYYFTVGNSSQQFNVYKTNYFLKDEDVATLLAKFSAGSTADITGIVSVYSGTFQIYPDTLDTIKVTAEATPEGIAKAFFDSVELPEAAKKDVELPTNESVTWALKAASEAAVIDKGVLKVTRQAEDAKVTLVATYTVSGQTFTREYEVVVVADSGTDPVVVTDFAENVGYKLGIEHTNLNGRQFFVNGKMDGYYYGTTEIAPEGANIYVDETEEGKYTLATIAGGALSYLEIIQNGNYTNVVYNAAPTSHWTYDTTLNTFVTDLSGVKYFLGTSNTKTYTTLSACKVEKAAENVVAHLYTLPVPEVKLVEAPAAGNSYKLGLEHGKLNQTLFINGSMSGYYYATVTDATAGADVNVVEATGGVHLKVGSKFMEIQASGTHINVLYVDAATGVWTYDSTIKSYVFDVAGTKYFLGTGNDKTYNTLSACKLSEASKYFVAHCYAAPEAETYVVNEANPGKSYYFGFVHTNLDDTKYFVNGEMDGYYFGTTTTLNGAAQVEVVEATGGVQFKVGSKFMEIKANGTYINVVYVDAATGVWTYDSTIKSYVFDVAGTKYFLGTSSSKTYTTLSACKLEKASENLVAQFWRTAETASEELVAKEGQTKTVIAYTGETTNMGEGDNSALLGLTGWTVAAEKNGNNNYPGLNKAGEIRLYGNPGNTITFTLTSGTIKYIQVVFADGYATGLGVTAGTAAVAQAGNVYVINGNTFTLANVNESTAQVRIVSINVITEPAA